MLNGCSKVHLFEFEIFQMILPRGKYFNFPFCEKSCEMFILSDIVVRMA